MKEFKLLILTIALAITSSFRLSAQLIDEDFESITSDIPTGWEKTSIDGFEGPLDAEDNWNLFTEDTERPKCLRFDSYYGEDGAVGILKTPAFAIGAMDQILTFDWKNPTGGNFAIYLSTDGGATFTTMLANNMTGQHEWTEQEISLSAYKNMSNLKIIFHATSNYGDDKDICHIFLDNVKVADAPTCAKPIELSITELKQTSVILNWNLADAGNIPTKYSITVQDINGNYIVNNPALVTTSTSIQITGLSANSSYTVLLQSDCTDDQKGKSSVSTPFTFTTICDAVSLPYNNNFTNETGILPNCWIAGGSYANTVALSTYETAGAEGDKSMTLESSEYDDSFLSTPQLAHAGNDMEISYKIFGEEKTPYAVALMSDVKDVSTAHILMYDTIRLDEEWYEVVLNTASYANSNTNTHFVFLLNKGDDYTLFVDDLSIYETPSCVRPENLIITNLGTTSVDLTWDSNINNLGSNFEIRILGGFEEEIVSTTTSTYTCNSLLPNTQYTMAVRQICSEGDTSAWSRSISFETRCVPVTLFPILEGFESTTFPPDCWYTMQTKVGSGIDYGDKTWTYSTTEYTGTKSAEFRYCGAGTRAILISPHMTLPSANSHEVSFWIERDDEPEDKEGIRVWVNNIMDTLGGTLLGHIPHSMHQIPVVTSEGWYQYTFPITMSGNVYIIFEGISQRGTSTHIDEVTIKERPSCLAVLDIKLDSTEAFSAHFSWDIEVGSASEWVVNYKSADESNFTEVTVTEPHIEINGLSPATQYDYTIKVKSSCGDEFSEEIEQDFTLITQCIPSTLPYLETFNDGNFKDSRQYCWDFRYLANKYSILGSADYEMRINGGATLILQELNLDTWAGKRIEMKIRTTSSNTEPVQIGLMEDVNDISSFQVMHTVYPNTEKSVYYVDLTTDNASRRMAVRTTSSADYVYFDNFRVYETPTCESVKKIEINEAFITSTSAQVSINDTINNKWEIKLCPLPYDIVNEQSISTTNKNHTLNLLNPNTQYTLKVRAVCSESDNSEWSDAIVFQTKCEPYAVTELNPFFEGFEEGYIDDEPVAGCWSQDLVTQDDSWIANNIESNKGRLPYAGNWNAYLKWNNEAYLVRSLQLQANKTYQFSCYARQDDNNSEIAQLNVSLSPTIVSGHNGTMIVNNMNLVNGDYQYAEGFFSVPEDGIYYLKVGAEFGDNYYISIDNIKIEEVPCAPPMLSDIQITTLSDTSISMQWVGSEQYLLRLSTTSIDPNATTGNISNDTLLIANYSNESLTPNTTYYYYIRSLCDGGLESNWSAEGSFKTQCENYTLPMYENFEEDVTSLDCWTSLFGSSSATINTSYSKSGNNSIRLSGGVTLSSPRLDTGTLASKQFTSWIYTHSDTVRYAIGVTNDLTNSESYIDIQEVVITNPNQWTEVTAYFDVLSDDEYSEWMSAKYIVISVSEDYTIYIDDISIDDMPPCPKPISLAISNITDHSVEIDWMSQEESSWNLRLTYNDNTVVDTVLNAHPVEITGLTQTTNYGIELQSICSPGELSDTAKAHFSTICPEKFTLPYSENFNTYANNSYVNCWTDGETVGDSWYTNKEPNEVTTPTLEFDSYNNRDVHSIIHTPIFDLSEVSAAQLEFEYMSDMAGDFWVMVSTNGGTSYVDTILYIAEESGINELTLVEYDLTQYCGGDVVIGFKGVSNYGNDDAYIRVDNIALYVPNSCIKPISIEITDVYTDSVRLNINDTTDATTWEVAVLPVGIVVNESTVFTTFTNSNIVFKGLTPAKSYVAHVRTVCGEEASRIISSIPFYTKCLPIATLPFNDSFERYETEAEMMCYDFINEYTDGSYPYAYLSSKSSYVNTGSQSLYLNGSGDTTLYVVLPQLSISIDTVSMSFNYKNSGTSDSDGELEMGLLPSSLHTSDFILLESYSKVSNFTKVFYDFITMPYSGLDYRIAFRYKTPGSNGKGIIIDDIELTYAASCIAPSGIEINDVKGTYADIRILDEIDNVSWQIAYGLCTESETEWNKLLVNNDSVRIEGLTISSEYKVKVRSVCGGDSSRWTNTYRFNTPCDPTSIPYAEGFESYTSIDEIACIDFIDWAADGEHPTAEFAEDDFANTGTTGLKFISSRDNILYYVLPEFNAPIDTLSLNFHYYNEETTGKCGNFQLGLIPLNLDTTQFILLENYPRIDAMTEIDYEFYFSGYKGTGYRIVFRYTTGSRDDYWGSLDDINISYRIPCFPAERARVLSTTTTTATIAIEDNAMNHAWELAYGESGTTLDAMTIISAHNDTLNIEGLNADTSYDIYVRAKCGGGNSVWSAPTNFNTLCNPITIDEATPYTESFDVTPANEIPSCWTVIMGNSNYPTVGVEDTIRGLKMYNTIQAIALPLFTQATHRLQLSFDANYVGNSTDGDLFVGYTNELFNYNAINYIYKVIIQKDRTIHCDIDLTIVPDSAGQIVFSTGYDNIIIDNVEVRLAPECYPPNAIEISEHTDTSVVVDYMTSPNNESVEVGLFRNGVKEQSMWINGEQGLISGLEDATNYGIVLRSACFDGTSRDTTEWSDTIYFKTLSTPPAIPYTNNFEDNEENSMWNIVGFGENQWIIGDSDISAVRNGTGALYVSNNGANNSYNMDDATSRSWAYRTLYLETGLYNLSYYFKCVGEESYDYLRVFLAPSNIDLSNANHLSDGIVALDEEQEGVNQITWLNRKKEFMIDNPGYYNLAFYWNNDNMYGDNPPAAIDSLELFKYTCSPISDISVEDITTNTVTLKLKDLNYNVLAYEVGITTNNEAPIADEEITTITNPESNIITIDNLLSGTYYNAFARVLCTTGDTTVWTPALQFFTNCEADTIDEDRYLREEFTYYEQNTIVDQCWQQININREEQWMVTADEEAKLTTGNTDCLRRKLYLFNNKEYTFKALVHQNTSILQNAHITVNLVKDIDTISLINTNVSDGEKQEISGSYSCISEGEYTLEIKANIAGDNNYITIDDILFHMDLCPEPILVAIQHIRGTSADIVWTSDASRTRIVVEEAGIDTIITNIIGNNNLRLTNLTPTTNYILKLTSMCDIYTSFTQEAVFSTPCSAKNLPYENDFNAYSLSEIPTCWDNKEGECKEEHRWMIKDDGTNRVMMFNSRDSESGDQNILTTQAFNIDGDNYILSFDYKNPNGGKMSAFLSTNGGYSYCDTILFEAEHVNTWTTAYTDLCEYSGNELNIIFHSLSNSATGDANHYLDNMRIACFGGEVEVFDTVCIDNPYIGYGFNIPAKNNDEPGVVVYERKKLSSNANECDSIIKLNLLTSKTYEHVIYDSICDGESYNKGLFVNITQPGQYTEVFTSIYGCDSSVTLVLSHIDLDVTIDTTICEGDLIKFGETYYGKTGTYSDTAINSRGCDSITTLILTVIPKLYEYTETICEGSSIEWNNKTYMDAGRYVDSLKNINGCDSIVVLNVSVNSTTFSIDTTICEGQTIYFNGEYLDSTGTYVHNVISFNTGCDSTTTLNLTITPRDTVILNDYVCEGDDYTGNGFAKVYITQDTILYNIDKDDDGCEIVTELRLRFSPIVERYDTITIMQDSILTFCDNTYSTAGDYVCQRYTTDGCDSIIYLHLIVEDRVNTDLLNVNSNLVIYPNPINSGSRLNITHEDFIEDGKQLSIEILDATGRIVLRDEHILIQPGLLQIDAPYTAGFYNIRITVDGNKTIIGKLIVK